MSRTRARFKAAVLLAVGSLVGSVALVGSAGLVGLAAPAHAATSYTWTGNGSTNAWTDPQNWGGGGYPGDGDSAVIDASGKTAHPQLNGPVSLVSLTILEPVVAYNASITGSGSITVTNQLTWTGGNIEVDLTVAAGAVGVISNPKSASQPIQFGAHDATAQLFTIDGTVTMTDLGGFGSSQPTGYEQSYLPNGGLLLRDDISLSQAATLNLVGMNEFWSDCCVSPVGLINNGSVVVSGTWLSQARYDVAGVTELADGSTAILNWPTYASDDLYGGPQWVGSGLVCICGNGNVTWSGGEVLGGFVLDGEQTIASGVEVRVDAGADVGGVGAFTGSGDLVLGYSEWKAKSTVKGNVSVRTMPGKVASISTYDSTHTGVIGQLTLATGGTVVAGSKLSLGPDKSLTIPAGRTLAVPNGAWIGASGCCTGGAALIVNGTLAVGGGNGQRLGAVDPGVDPAYLQWPDLGGSGTVTFTGTTEWDIDPNHHFSGTFKGSGTILGDLPIAKATFAPTGKVSVTDDFSIAKGGTYLVKVSGTKAKPKVTAALKVADSISMGGLLKITGVKAKRNKTVTPISFKHNVYGTKFTKVTGAWKPTYAAKSVKLKAR